MAHWLEKVVTLLQAETSDLRELARLAGGNAETFYRGIQLSALELDGQDIEGMEFSPRSEVDGGKFDLSVLVPINSDRTQFVEIGSLLKLIRNVGTQEERLALLLRLVLENRDFGVEIIKAYGRDKAKYANRGLGALESVFSDEKSQMSLFGFLPAKRHGDAVLARTIYLPFSKGMPSNRAALIVYMTRHLASYPKINQYLRIRVERATSIFLEPYREEIRRLLDNPLKIEWITLLAR
jgi:hypothetical protein